MRSVPAPLTQRVSLTPLLLQVGCPALEGLVALLCARRLALGLDLVDRIRFDLFLPRPPRLHSLLPPPAQYPLVASHGLIDDDDEGELQRYKTAVEKEWAKFGEIGFSDVDEKKLEFDLTEGEREAVRRKRDTMDWVRSHPSW